MTATKTTAPTATQGVLSGFDCTATSGGSRE